MDAEHTTDERTRLEQQAAKTGMSIAVERVDGHWRAGLLAVNELGEPVFVLHASGRDEDSAIRNLAAIAADRI